MDTEILKKLISRRHPQYEDSVKHWTFLDSTYRGGREWFKDNIYPYHKEGDEEFKKRIERAYRFNHTREVVDIINKYLFRGNITRSVEVAPKVIVDFWRKATLDNNSIKNFMKEVSRKSSIYGSVWVVVDNTAKTSSISVADERQNKARVYAYLVDPQDVLDVSFDEENEFTLNWILLRENRRDDVDVFTSSGKAIERYRLWTKEAWYIIERTNSDTQRPVYEIVNSRAHTLGMVPVFQHANVKSDERYAPPALINDIAYLDRAVANYCSNIDVIIQDQSFSQLVLPAQSGTEESETQRLITISTKRAFTYDAESGAAPFYLSPDPKQAQIILEAINKIIVEIYQTVGMAGERTKTDNAMGIDNSSGVAKAYDFDRINSLLVAKADQCEDTEHKIIDLVLAWYDQTRDQEQQLVSYPDDFDVRGVYNEFDLAQKLSDMGAPHEVRRRQMKDLVAKLWPILDDKAAVVINKDIDKWPENLAEVQQNLQAGANNVANSKKKDNNSKPVADRRQGQVTKETA